MLQLIQDTGFFAIPLLICSFLGVFVVVERVLSLNWERVFPKKVLEWLEAGKSFDQLDLDAVECSTAGRIVRYYEEQAPDAQTLKAYVNLEVKRLERGLNWLDMVVGIAPLIGLLGTVAGLVAVFGQMPQGAVSADNMFYAQGIALALSTTMFGLGIAIPSVVASGYLNRRVDVLEARLYWLAERLLGISDKDLFGVKSSARK